MKILVIQQKMIGDVLTSSILFEALRQKFPKAQLDYLINEHTYPVVENNPFIDRFIFFTKKEETSKKALTKLGLNIRQNKYDILIDVYSKISSNIISLLSQASKKVSYYKPYTSFIYTNNIKRLKETNEALGLAIVNRMQLLSPLSIDVKSIKPKIYLSDHEIKNSRTFLEEHVISMNFPIYMISVLGSGENKTYPFDYMAKVIDFIVQEKPDSQILFNYIPKQKEDARSIYDLCKKETQRRIYLDVFGKSIRDFLSITYHCNALIGNEGGAINMAKALNIKTFAIFSPWIDKKTWSLFEDDQNIGVHLKDYKPEIYTAPEKTFKKDALRLYKEFQPEYFLGELKIFLKLE